MNSRTTRRWLAAGFLAALTVFSIGRAWGIGFILSQTREELKLKYEVTAEDHGTGRVTIVLTLKDEGRLKPLDDVQFVIPAQEKNKDGSYWMDLVVSPVLTQQPNGDRVARVHILRSLAERAEFQLNTHTLDGKTDPLTRLHHVIHIADSLKSVPQVDPPK